MEIKFLEKKKDEIKLEMSGIDHHTVGNLLRKEAFKNSSVTFAAYKKGHPMIDKSEFILKTKNADARKVLKDIIKDLATQFTAFKSELEKLK